MSVTVHNTGDLDGKEVVQVYMTDVVSSVVTPNQELVGFQKVDLAYAPPPLRPLLVSKLILTPSLAQGGRVADGHDPREHQPARGVDGRRHVRRRAGRVRGQDRDERHDIPEHDAHGPVGRARARVRGL